MHIAYAWLQFFFESRTNSNWCLFWACQSKEDAIMPRGNKSAYTAKQKRQAEDIEDGYEDRGVSKGEAERRAWATVNKSHGAGNKSGEGRGKSENKSSYKKGDKAGVKNKKKRTKKKENKTGTTATARPKAARSASAKKAAKTRANKRSSKSA